MLSLIFLVGSGRTLITVHTSFISLLLLALNALINNGAIKESVEQVAELEDVMIDVFTGFCKYAYTSDYKTLLVLEEFSINLLGSSNLDIIKEDLKPIGGELNL